MVNLDSSVAAIPGVGEVYAKKLEKIGVLSVKDLLLYFPRRWEDFSHITPIAEIRVGEPVSVRGVVWDIATKKSKKGKPVTEVILSDESGTTKAVWFNQPFLEKNLQKGEEIFIAGTLEFAYGQVSFNSPAYEKVHEEGITDLRHVGKIIPIYSETDGLSSKWLRSKIADLAKLVYGLKDHLPQEVKEKNDLMELSAAVRSMHYPETMSELKKAKKRFLFDDLFCLFCSVLSNKKEIEKNQSIAIQYDEELGKKFVQSLPYELTNSQRKAAWQILKDLDARKPMNRLLEGDVGSGKTVVAAMAALMVAARGYQTVILAPTEILASQHFLGLSEMLAEFDINVVLLTGGLKEAERREVSKSIEDGEAQVIVGTHALLSADIKYWTLALVVVDEQHRFGVEQRKALKQANGETGTMPHFLSMSATPIPRTLAITVFGDLDISVLDEVPRGRQKVATFLVPHEKREDGYKFIDEKIEEGRQVFVICPLVSESDKLGVKSVEEEAERLQSGTFAHRKVALLHGKMKKEEKEQVMADFKGGKINILVSTSVIEVGVDVPNASIILIEGADRFGLAQLHQFRGRVGRGEHKSFCFLFTESESEVTRKRLEALIDSENGFELAEKDLEIRGPGELLGIKQHGKIDATLLEAMRNPVVISAAKESANYYLDHFDLAVNPALSKKIEEYKEAAKLE